jgi:D-mannonate dehydratase
MTKDKDWQAYAEESQQNAAIQRQQLLEKLEKYRKKGWDQEVLHYGLPFREDQRTLEQLAHHVRRIERAHREHIRENVLTALKLIGIITFLVLAIFK